MTDQEYMIANVCYAGRTGTQDMVWERLKANHALLVFSVFVFGNEAVLKDWGRHSDGQRKKIWMEQRGSGGKDCKKGLNLYSINP